MSPVKPACDLECASEIARDAAKLSRELAEIAGAFRQSEQYREADTATIARLRRELAEARADISVLRDDRDRIRTVSAEALALRDRLSTIVDEAFGLQEVLGMDALLARLERLLTERARQYEEVRRERDEWREWADYHSSWALIDAERPPDAELRARIGELCDVVTGEEWAKSNGECAEARAERDEARRERDEARANYQFMVERAADQRLDGYRELGARAAAAENERDEARVALRDLIDSVEATKCRDTIVLRDLDAARAVLGDQS